MKTDINLKVVLVPAVPGGRCHLFTRSAAGGTRRYPQAVSTAVGLSLEAQSHLSGLGFGPHPLGRVPGPGLLGGFLCCASYKLGLRLAHGAAWQGKRPSPVLFLAGSSARAFSLGMAGGPLSEWIAYLLPTLAWLVGAGVPVPLGGLAGLFSGYFGVPAFCLSGVTKVSGCTRLTPPCLSACGCGRGS